MNNDFSRWHKLAGLLTEAQNWETRLSEGDTDYDRAKDSKGLGKDGEEHIYGAGVKAGEKIEKKKMTKSEARQAIKDAILAEMEGEEERAYEEAANMDETIAEAKEEEEAAEEVDVTADETADGEEVDMAVDTAVDTDMAGGEDLDAGSSEAKKAFNELTDAYRAAKELGDEKLVRQLANTITYFNKNIILQND